MSKTAAPSAQSDQRRPAINTADAAGCCLVHQLPPNPSNLRVRTWRRLQELGAVAVKQSVYVLPDNPESREDFESLKVEIEGSGGEAIRLLRRACRWRGRGCPDRGVPQSATARVCGASLGATASSSRRAITASTGRPRRDLARYRQRFAAIERIDFFGSAGRDRVVSLLAELEAASGAGDRKGKTQKAV